MEPAGRQEASVLAALGRACRVALLASDRLGPAAARLRAALEAAGCAVVPAFGGDGAEPGGEGAAPGGEGVEPSGEVAEPSGDGAEPSGGGVAPSGGARIDAVVVLGASPGAAVRAPPLAEAMVVAFGAIEDGAPVYALCAGSAAEEADASPVLRVAAALRHEPAAARRRRLGEAWAAAAEEEGPELRERLLRWPELRVARPQADGRTLLHAAAARGSAAAVAALLEAGAAWRAEDAAGRTAGDVAFEAGHQAVFDALVGHAAAAVRREAAPGQEDSEEPVAKRRRAGQEAYLHEALRYDEDRLLDEAGRGVMLGWEAPLMRRHAEALLPEPGARVLNIGFGLGLVDGFLQERRPHEHHIVEAHPDVLAELRRRGWARRPGVAVHAGRWQDVLAAVPLASFDAVFFDTWQETYVELRAFIGQLPRLLRPGGRFSYFNGLAPYSVLHHAAFCRAAQEDLAAHGLRCAFAPLQLGHLGDEAWRGVVERYWQFEVYYLPLAELPPHSALPSAPETPAWRAWPAPPVRVGDAIGAGPCGDGPRFWEKVPPGTQVTDEKADRSL